jgi:hypothetical protein
MPPLSPNMMTRAKAEEIIRNKGSITYNGQIISDLAQLDSAFPAPEELIDASDPVASNEAIGALRDQMAELHRREQRLLQRQSEAAKPAKAAAGESKPKAARAPKGAKAARAAALAQAGDQPADAARTAEPAKPKRAPRRGKASKKKT